MIRPARLLTFLALAAVVAAPADAHRFFVSLAEVEYNAERGALEVALRVDDHNLEDALRLREGKGYRLTTDAAGERLARAYVEQHFRVLTAAGQAQRLDWVGWEWTPGMAWLYFEFPVTGDPAGLHLEHSVFLELSDEQVNTVNVRSPEGRHTLTFDRKAQAAALGLTSGP